MPGSLHTTTDTAKQDHRQNCVNDVENNAPAIDYIILVLQTDAENLAAPFKTELSQEWVIEMAHKAYKGCNTRSMQLPNHFP